MSAMQAAMQRHIDRTLVNGAYLHLDMNTGEVHLLYPAQAHTTVLSMGDYFVLCSDFRDAADGSVNVDFYLAREDDRFVVFHSVVDDRDVLRQWLREGKARRLD